MLKDLSNEELCEKLQAGEEKAAALEALWEKNQGVIRKTCTPYMRVYGEEDVMQESFLAMYKAAVTFDSSQEVSFLTWLTNTVKWHFSRRNSRRYGGQMELLILDSPLKSDEDGDTTALDLVIGDSDPASEAENDLLEAQIRETVNRCVDKLPQEEAEVITARFFYQAPLDVISANMGISKSSVEVLRGKALNRLRKKHGAVLRACLDALDEVRYSSGLQGVGVQRFNNTWTSSTERTALLVLQKAERRTRKELLSTYVFTRTRPFAAPEHSQRDIAEA